MILTFNRNLSYSLSVVIVIPLIVLVTLSLLLIFRIHADAVESNRFDDLLTHDINVAVVGKLQVEKACVCLW